MAFHLVEAAASSMFIPSNPQVLTLLYPYHSMLLVSNQPSEAKAITSNTYPLFLVSLTNNLDGIEPLRILLVIPSFSTIETIHLPNPSTMTNSISTLPNPSLYIRFHSGVYPVINAFRIWGSDSPFEIAGGESVSSTEWTSLFHSSGEVSARKEWKQYNLATGFRHMKTIRMTMENGSDSSVSVYETTSIQPHYILFQSVLLVQSSS